MTRPLLPTALRGANDTSKVDDSQTPFGEDPYAPTPETGDTGEDRIRPDIEPNDAGDEGTALGGRQ